jgi:hypothetical protein
MSKKSLNFKLNPEWMFKEPIDFEYNKYTLLDYLQKCGKNFDEFKVYPDFIELSLHIANNQSLAKENILLLTDKKFDSFDDEILLRELYPKIPRNLSDEEKEELKKTLIYSNVKLIDTFNFAKSIWSLAYDNVQLSIRKNKDNIRANYGFIILIEKTNMKIWLYQIKKIRKENSNKKVYLKQLYNGEVNEETLNYHLENPPIKKDSAIIKKYPVFEARITQELPMEETIIPIFKRKILTMVYQSKQKV